MDLKALDRRSAKRQGFTLIELMVAITVSLFITGAVIVNYNSYNATQVLKQAALTVKNDFRFIQAKAANGEKPSSGCATLDGWSITFAASSYAYRAYCNGAGVGTTSTIALPSGVTFSTLPATNPIIVKVLSRGTNLANTVTITLSSSGKQYNLQVNSAGDVSDLGLQQ